MPKESWLSARPIALALGFPGLSSPNSLPKPLQRSGLLTLISDSGAVALRIDAHCSQE